MIRKMYFVLSGILVIHKPKFQMPNIYEQKRKRHALKQIQQRSKRLATQNSSTSSTSQWSSETNPFLQPPDQTSNSTYSSVTHEQHTSKDEADILYKRNPKTKSQNSDALQKADLHIRSEDQVTFEAKQGTCMFMCSLKEFNNRLNQDIYHKLETRNGDFVHELAIKEYKRSSADQNESEVSDLRPSIILLKTVQYLCMDLVDNTSIMFEELYDFIWNRTRAIRKDITQQKLSDNNTIAVLETIVRFHIFSAYRMANSGSESFEQKYNNENLEKTLTSLRHLYADKEKLSENCPNEAEFRMYHILLNLNNGHVMYWFNMLSDRVRWSPQVSYALDCYKAYNSNNYIQFFRLVKRGSLLSSCILYRYINNVREKAIVSIINSHAKNSCDYPLSKFENMLCFESINDTRSYLHAMEIESNEITAFLNNRCYTIVNKESEVKMSIIERKIILRLGSVLYTNEPVPDTVFAVTPHSFNISPPSTIVGDHILKHVSNSLIVQLCLNEVVSIIHTCVHEKAVLERSKILLTKDILEELCKRVLKEEMDAIKTDLRKTVIHHTKMLYQDVYTELYDTLLKELVRESIVEEANSRYCKEVQIEILDTVTRKQLVDIVSSEAKIQLDFSRKCGAASEDVCDKLITEILSHLLRETCTEIINEVRKNRKFKLNQELSKNVIQKRYYFSLWKKKHRNIMLKRHSLDEIPPRLKPSSSTEVLRKLLRPKSSSSAEIRNNSVIGLTSPTKLYKRRSNNFKKLLIRMDLLEEAVAVRGIPLTSLCHGTYLHPIYITVALHTSQGALSSFLLDCFSMSNVSWNRGYCKKQCMISTNIFRIQALDLDMASSELFINSCKFSSLVIILSDDNKFIDLLSTEKLTDCLVISSEHPRKPVSRFVQKPKSLSRMSYCSLYKELDRVIPGFIVNEKLFRKFKVVDVRDLLQSLICSKITDILLSKHLLISQSNYSCNVYPNKIISFYNHLLKSFSSVICCPDLKYIDWPTFFDARSDVHVDWNSANVFAGMFKDLDYLRLPYFTGESDSVVSCLSYIKSLKTNSLQFLIGRINVIIKQKGLGWMLILNQAIHHIIENASFERPYTVIYENDLKEVQSINSERFIEDSIEWLSNDFIDTKFDNYENFESEIADIWTSLSHYETIISNNKSNSSITVENKEPISDGDLEKVKSLGNEIQKLKTVMETTESKLQSILNDGALPLHIMTSKMFANMP